MWCKIVYTFFFVCYRAASPNECGGRGVRGRPFNFDPPSPTSPLSHPLILLFDLHTPTLCVPVCARQETLSKAMVAKISKDKQTHLLAHADTTPRILAKQAYIHTHRE